MHLDDNQLKAANMLNGPLRIIACPGSGKTTTILERAHNIIMSGVPAVNVVMITFSKQAADHMRDKYVATYGSPIPTISTIHSMCFSILKNCNLLNPVISDIDKYNILSDYMVDEIRINKIDIQSKIPDFLLELSSVKLRELDISRYESSGFEAGDFRKIYHYYEDQKKKMNKIDFEDMLINTRNLLRSNKDILSTYQQKCIYITVDEFQDTDKIQSDIIYMLAADNHNICVVGDVDQSIYRFRGADPEIMLDFNKVFLECKDISLTTNYRSKKNIVDSAAVMIQNNKKRFKIPIKANSTDYGNIEIKSYNLAIQQWQGIVNTIRNLHDTYRIPYEEMAVLCRTNNQNRIIVGELMNRNIPFFTTEKIKDYHSDVVYHDILAYYRISHGFENDGDLNSIMRRPETYISRSLFDDLSTLNNETYEIINNRLKSVSNRQNKERLLRIRYNHIKRLAKIDKPCLFVDYMCTFLGYKKGLENYANTYGRELDILLDILDTLKDESENFETMPQWELYVDNYMRQLSKQNDKKTGVCISTYHSSKGLEWEVVFLPDSVDGKTPFKKASSEDDFEEERRLYYVASTRAKSRLFISNVDVNGKIIPSPYINEMNIEHSPLLKEEKNLFDVKF